MYIDKWRDKCYNHRVNGCRFLQKQVLNASQTAKRREIFSMSDSSKWEVTKYQQARFIDALTSELAPLDPLPFTGIYAVTKSALDKYAYSLRMELQLLGICVSVIRAGAVDTGMLGVSTRELDRFCANTKLYSCNAKRFKGIVGSVEARRVPPEKIAAKAYAILTKRSPRFAYCINRNPLLLLLNALPKRLQLWAIRQVLR